MLKGISLNSQIDEGRPSSVHCWLTGCRQGAPGRFQAAETALFPVFWVRSMLQHGDKGIRIEAEDGLGVPKQEERTNPHNGAGVSAK